MLIANFQYQFYSKLPYFDPELRLEAENRLRDLAKDRNDITGASVALDAVAHRRAPYLYQARVVARMKRESVAAAERGETLELALRRALDAVERQVRERRHLHSKPWQAH